MLCVVTVLAIKKIFKKYKNNIGFYEENIINNITYYYWITLSYKALISKKAFFKVTPYCGHGLWLDQCN